ncbi:MAG: hypothetical protein LBB34_02235 [Holosporales bacterium]|nr:hypothetical protein [Holosporales bacterium]
MNKLLIILLLIVCVYNRVNASADTDTIGLDKHGESGGAAISIDEMPAIRSMLANLGEHISDLSEKRLRVESDSRYQRPLYDGEDVTLCVKNFFETEFALLPPQLRDLFSQTATRLLANCQFTYSMDIYDSETVLSQDLLTCIQLFEKAGRYDLVRLLMRRIIMKSGFDVEATVAALPTKSPLDKSKLEALRRAVNLEDTVVSLNIFSPNPVVAFLTTVHEVSHAFPAQWMRFSTRYFDPEALHNLETFSLYFELRAAQCVIANPGLLAECSDIDDAFTREIVNAHLIWRYGMIAYQCNILRVLCTAFPGDLPVPVTDDFVEVVSQNMVKFAKSQSDAALKEHTEDAMEGIMTILNASIEKSQQIGPIMHCVLNACSVGLLRVIPLLTRAISLMEVLDTLGSEKFNLGETLLSSPSAMQFLLSMIAE